MASNQFAIDQFNKGKAGKGSALRSTGDKLFSYWTVILQRTSTGKLISNITKYSVTTSEHQFQARIKRADHQVDGVPRGTTDLITFLLATDGGK